MNGLKQVKTTAEKVHKAQWTKSGDFGPIFDGV